MMRVTLNQYFIHPYLVLTKEAGLTDELMRKPKPSPVFIMAVMTTYHQDGVRPEEKERIL